MKTLLVSVMPCLLVTIGLYAYTKNLKTPAVSHTQTAAVDKPSSNALPPQNNALITGSEVNNVLSKEESMGATTHCLTSNTVVTGTQTSIPADAERPLPNAKNKTTGRQAPFKKANASDTISWAAVPVEP